MKKVFVTLLVGFTLSIAFVLSPFSYFYVTFNQPFPPEEFLVFLEDYNIDPAKHNVYVLSSHLERPEGISKQQMMIDSRSVTDAVFNSRFYVVKALFDDRVKDWEFAGPRHPYD